MSTVIHDLAAKIIFIAETFTEMGRCNSPSLDALAKALGMNRATLRSAIEQGQVSTSLEAELAAKAGFDPANIAWKDTRIEFQVRARDSGPRYLGQDTANNFRTMLRKAHGLPTQGSLVLRQQPPVHAKKNLAQIDFSAAQVGVGEAALPLLVWLFLDVGYHDSGVSYGFRKVRIRLDAVGAGGPKYSDVLGAKAPEAFGSAMISAVGKEFDVFWHISAPSGVLSGSFVSEEQPLAKLWGLSVGDQLVADLSVRPLDGELWVSDDTHLNLVQRQIIKALMAEKLPGSSDGWISLGRQILNVARD